MRAALAELETRKLVHPTLDLTAEGCAVHDRLAAARRAHLAELAEEWDPAHDRDAAAYLERAVRESVPDSRRRRS